LKKSWKYRSFLRPDVLSDVTPGGIVAMLSSLPTRTVNRTGSPHRTRSVTSASNGV